MKLDEMINKNAKMLKDYEKAVKNGDGAEALRLAKEIQEMQNKIDLELANRQMGQGGKGKDGAAGVVGVNGEEEKNETKKKFLNAFRTGNFKGLLKESGEGKDGGYLVPQDIVTKIEKFVEDNADLAQLVQKIPVSTKSGSRTLMKRRKKTGFKTKEEGGKTNKGELPEFMLMEYECKKMDGYYPVTQELVDDSDEDIENIIVEWIGEESITTDNVHILELLQKTKLVDTKDTILDTIEYAFTVKLGAALSSNAVLILNDDAWFMLSTQKDADGKKLLQPDLSNPLQYKLFGLYSVKRVSNEEMPSDTSVKGKRKVTMYVANMWEYCKIFDRQQVTIRSTDVGAIGELNAFDDDLIIYKGSVRKDYKVKDEKAAWKIEVTIDDPKVEGVTSEAGESTNDTESGINNEEETSTPS